MEKIINNPGLQHLVENFFFNLNVEDLKICAQINQSSKQILENPMFWLRKFEDRLSKENQNEWIKIIQSSENSKKKKVIAFYLQWNLKKYPAMDLPCCTGTAIQEDFKKKIFEACNMCERSSDEDIEIVKILAPLTENPIAPNKYGNTSIHTATQNGHIEIVKFLASFTDNPNAPNKDGETPIYWAANYGHTEIVKILAPLTDTPNAPNNNGETPISLAAFKGHTEITKILAPLTDNLSCKKY